jgi:hypothetical protein
LKGIRAIGTVGVNAGQCGLAEWLSGGFDFPKQLFIFGIAEVIKVFHIYNVESFLTQPAVIGLDRPHCGETVSNPNRLTDLGDRRFVRHLEISSRTVSPCTPV